MLNLSINQLVEDNLPAGFTVSQGYIDRRLAEWQYLLRDAAELTDEESQLIGNWSDEWRMVLAYCIVYDIIMKIISGAIVFKDVTTTTGGNIVSGGEVKKITTGPTEVEYFNTKESWVDLIKYWLAPDGIATLLFAKACMAAAIVGVKLPFCGARKVPMGPKVMTFKKPCTKLCRRG